MFDKIRKDIKIGAAALSLLTVAGCDSDPIEKADEVAANDAPSPVPEHIIRELQPRPLGEFDKIAVLYDDGVPLFLPGIELDSYDLAAYQAAKRDWGIKMNSPWDFEQLQKSPEAKAALVTPENAPLFREIVERYNVGPLTAEYFRIEHFVDNGVDVLERKELLLDPEIEALIKDRFGSLYEDWDGEEKLFLPRLAEIAQIESLVDKPLFTSVVLTLSNDYSFNGRELVGFLADRQVSQGLLDLLGTTELQKSYTELKDAWGDRGKDALLQRLMRFERPEQVEAVYEQFEELKFGFSPESWNGKSDTRTVLKIMASMADDADVILQEDFVEFAEVVREVAADELNFGNISELTQIYKHFDGDIDKFYNFVTEKFPAAKDYLARNFLITDFGVAEVLTLVCIADSLNTEEANNIVAALVAENQPPDKADAVLIATVSGIPELAAIACDAECRTEVVEELNQIYKKQAFPRKKLEGSKSYNESYTERPALEELPALELIRLKLLWDALQNGDAINTLQQIVGNDLSDRSTEAGGILEVVGAKLQLREIAATVDESSTYSHLQNGMYSSYLTGRFHAGIGTFHLHATSTDSGDFTGPSGSFPGFGGDASHVAQTGQTGVVISTMGHPRDGTGEEQTSKLRINIDMYFAEHFPGEEAKLRVIDLGEFIINRDS